MGQRRSFWVGGTVPINGYVYVPRPQEEKDFLRYIRQGRWVNVIGFRTNGKSSMIIHQLKILEKLDQIKCVYIDVAGQIGKVTNFKEWLERFDECLRVDLEILLAEDVDEKTKQGPKISKARSYGPGKMLSNVLKSILDEKPSDRILIILDEIDFIRELPCTDEIVIALKAFQSEQSMNDELSRLSFCISGLVPYYELIDPKKGAASAIGDHITMDDFKLIPRVINTIADELPTKIPNRQAIVEEILKYTGGQPYLTMYFADAVSNIENCSIDDIEELVKRYLEEQRSKRTGLFVQIEQFILGSGFDSYSALCIYRDLLGKKLVMRDLDPAAIKLLLNSGLVRNNDNKLEIRCDIFKRFFDTGWIDGKLSQIAAKNVDYPRQSYGSHRQQLHGQSHRERICVINTGGTIGMVQDGDGESVRPPKNPQEFMDHYQEITELANIDFFQIFNLDSINVSPSHWSAIARAVYSRRKVGYSGFVIAHGTDTMAYSASAVAYALGPQLNFPVVFTGAQTTPDVRHGDARSNLYRSCLVALSGIHEVVICFNEYVFRACRAQKKDERRFDAFESPTFPPLAYITENLEVQLRRSALRKKPKNKGDIDLKDEFAEGILHIILSPGLEPEFFDNSLNQLKSNKDRLCQGIVIQTLGAGNIPSLDPYSLLPFIEKAVRCHIPVLVTSQYPWPPTSHVRFEPGEAASKAGAVFASTMTHAAAVAKFRWILSQLNNEILDGTLDESQRVSEVEKRMNKNLIGEIDRAFVFGETIKSEDMESARK